MARGGPFCARRGDRRASCFLRRGGERGAVASFAEGGNALAPKAAAVLVTKFTPAKDTASTLEATATYTGIESGRALLLCLSDPTGAFVAGGEGTADDTV